MFKSLLLKGRVLCVLLCIMASSLVVTAQTKHSGRVIGSDDKLPVVGASVRIKGTNTGAVTDVNGDFNLTLTPGNVLVVSYIGYKTKEVTVQGAEFMTISLEPAASTLNEVVVTGYTSQRKKDISGAVSVVDVNSSIKLPASTSDQLLQGQASGVTVLNQGAPGAPAQIFVRGVSNFGNSSPLIIVDGLQGGSLSNLNPNDIESISVLKDAGSAAIYGVSGGNGVIIVTTKKGKQGKTVFSYDAFYGSQSPKSGNVFNVLNASQYEQLVQKVDPGNSLLKNGGKFSDYGVQGPGGSPKTVANAGDPLVDPAKYHYEENTPQNDYLIQKFNNGVGTDWFHAIFKTAPMQQHSITASGASEKNSYLMSLAYLNQQGTLIDTYFKRYQARVNTSFNIKNYIRVGENMQVFYTDSPGLFGNLSEGNSISETYRAEPQIPIYDIAGNYGGTWAGPTQLGNAVNPVASQARNKYNHSKNWNIEGTAFAEADFLKHFTARTAISGVAANYYYANIQYVPYDSGEGHNNSNGASEGAGFNSNYNWSNTLNYSQVFGKHNVKVLAGYEARSFFGRQINSSTKSLFSTDPNYASITNGDPKSTITTSQINPPNSVLSVFGRLDYIYNDKYILGATIRRDGGSQFYQGRQYGTFPSVSLAWRISQEDFLKGVSWINDLKLRASYGLSGFNANVPGGNAYNQYGADPGSTSYDITGSSSGTIGGFTATQLGNKKTTWETDKILNFGIDASLFNHLDVSVEYYKKDVSNLLFRTALPATVGGAQAPVINIGGLYNKGLDAAITYHGKVSDLTFNVGVNVTSYKNQITKLASPFTAAGSRIGDLVRNEVGHPLGSFYGYKVIGYFNDSDFANPSALPSAADYHVLKSSVPTQADPAQGRFKYQDTNHDGKITDADRVFYGNPNPDFTYGVNLNAAYKGFDITAIFYGSHGNQNLNYVRYWTDFYSSLTGNKSLNLLNNSWSPTNLNPKAPIAELASTFSSSGVQNSFYLESGAFLKCRLVQIGYTFGAKQLKAVGVDKLHVYVSATNLFTITKYTGLDPEVTAANNNTQGQSGNNAQNAFGIDYGNYPNNQRQIILGVNLSF
jgi:TonB-linked SusC/RagA family outer membrane protein